MSLLDAANKGNRILLISPNDVISSKGGKKLHDVHVNELSRELTRVCYVNKINCKSKYVSWLSLIFDGIFS
jgi:hypothetical protein